MLTVCIKMTTNLKLGSNWKSCGVGAEMRRWDHGNGRINFGFCKGDDNFGGRKRKELDDFTKSLGKQMNLVLYRMEDTERVRYQLRERRRQEMREKAAREEEKEKKQVERMERNRKWRERKNGEEKLGSIAEERILDEKEERKQKNIEWRKRKESRRTTFQICDYRRQTSESLSLTSFLQPLLECPYCQAEMSSPG